MRFVCFGSRSHRMWTMNKSLPIFGLLSGYSKRFSEMRRGHTAVRRCMTSLVKSGDGFSGRSAAAHFAFRFHHEKFSLHVGMNIAPKGHLHRFADAGRRIRLRLLREMQRHRLPRLKMIRPVAFALLAADFDSVTFLFRDAFLEHGGTDAMGHRSLVLDDDPGQRTWS